MAKGDTTIEGTRLTADQLKQAVATGAALADVRGLQAEGHAFDEIMEILDIMSEERAAAETRQGNQLAAAVAGATAPDRIPENKHRHPRMSVYNPRGEFHKRINPTGIERPKIACETLYTGVPVDGDTDTNEEIELLNQIVKPGIYFCTQNDGEKFPVTVEVQYQQGTTDVITRKSITFKYEGLSRLRPAKTVTLKEIIAQQTPEPIRVSA